MLITNMPKSAQGHKNVPFSYIPQCCTFTNLYHSYLQYCWHTRLGRLVHQNHCKAFVRKMVHKRPVTCSWKHDLNLDADRRVRSAFHPLMHKRVAARRQLDEPDDWPVAKGVINNTWTRVRHQYLAARGSYSSVLRVCRLTLFPQ